MTPKQRIARVERWLAKFKPQTGPVLTITVDGVCSSKNLHIDRTGPIQARNFMVTRKSYVSRCRRANELFAAELRWLCEYATRNPQHVFISETRRLWTMGDSVFSAGETWRVVGVPESIPLGKRWRVTLEEVPSDTPFGEVKE